MTFDIAPSAYSICAAPPVKVEFRRGPPTIRTIQDTVADYYNLRRHDLLSQRRSREVSWPRQLAMYLCRELTHHSLPSIGKHFGGRDHTTVMHAVKAVQGRMAELRAIETAHDDLREALAA